MYHLTVQLVGVVFRLNEKNNGIQHGCPGLVFLKPCSAESSRDHSKGSAKFTQKSNSKKN